MASRYEQCYNDLVVLYEQYGEDSVNMAKNYFSDYIKKVMELFYNERKSEKELCEILNIRDVYNLESLLILANKKIEKFCKKEGCIVRLCNQFGKDNVLKVINSLDSESKNIMYWYYGLGEENPKSIVYIAFVLE
jgi:DNA-directed RNA polymerase specialized sigma subunit